MRQGGNSPHGSRAGAPAQRPSFRPDVEGLRAIALLVMLLFHAELWFAPGGYVGVDVFFVISGFLITRLLVHELEQSGSISLRRFYAYRMKRLLPLAGTVLVAVVVLSALLLPVTQQRAVGDDVLSSAFYVVNWHLAAEAVDYFAVGYDASPVQHFWTLSIEEQFYIAWPLLLLAFTAWWRGRGRSVRPGAMLAVGTVGVGCLAYGIWYSFESPNEAYFSTFARSWDMAIGALVALAPIPSFRRRTAALLCAAGLGGIAIGTFGFDVLTPYPGIAALVPAAGAALVIAAGGQNGDAARPSRLLGIAPLRFMGRISYSWYLWHWPALVFGGAVLGSLSLAERLALIGFSFFPALATHHFVEEPFRRAKSLKQYPRRAFAVGVASTATAVVAVAVMVAAQDSIPALPEDRVAGAAAVGEGRGAQHVARALAPTPVKAGEDRSAMQEDGCLVSLEQTRSPRCAYGDTESATTVVLFGDSLAQHYSPALERLAAKHGWRLVGLTKMGCPPAEVTVYNHRLEREYRECDEWRAEALRRIEREEDPELVLVSGRVSTPVMDAGEILDDEAGSTRMQDGYADVLERLRAASPRVAVIKDLPRSPRNVPDCVAEALENLDACAFRPEPDHYEAPDNRAAARVRGVKLIDLTPLVCPEGSCRAVIGDALVFRDYDHLTPTFAATLAPMIERRLPNLG